MQRVNSVGSPITVTKEFKQQHGSTTVNGVTKPLSQKVTKYTAPDTNTKKNITGLIERPLDKKGEPIGTWITETFTNKKSAGIGTTTTGEMNGFTRTRITEIRTPIANSVETKEKALISYEENVNSFRVNSLYHRKGKTLPTEIRHSFYIPVQKRELSNNPITRALQLLVSHMETSRLIKEGKKQTIISNLKPARLRSFDELQHILANMDTPKFLKETERIMTKPSRLENLLARLIK